MRKEYYIPTLSKKFNINNNMKEIIINKDWYDRLVEILDKLNKETELDDKIETHSCLSHLNGYIRSLDAYFKETKDLYTKYERRNKIK